ncbi:hypothetical protein JTB14_002484 [Gonioctena quinquepunctata]|nr:hypothetical protein JTB14_002484 [Gonioctena quinquepunctata]
MDTEREKQRNEKVESELSDLRKEHDQILRVTEMMKKDLEECKKFEEEQRTNLVTLKKESDVHKRERNVLAHQSTLILQGLNENSDGEECMMLLQEIEELKRALEEEKNKADEEITMLQERLEDEENNAQIEILEERLKLVESELQAANERADKAEEKLKAALSPPPPPPPPLPPLLPPPGSDPPRVPLRRRRSKVALSDLAETIGVQENTSPEKKAPAPGVNEDIINAIKAGQFTLKKAKKDKGKQDKEQPKAVSELLNILGSLRRAPKKRQSLFLGDVQL